MKLFIDISIQIINKRKDTPEQINIKKRNLEESKSNRTYYWTLKIDHRMQRNYLKGFLGDQINLY